MAEPSRYNTGDEDKDVFKNKLNIRTEEELHEAEGLLLQDAYQYFSDLLINKKLEFTSNLLIEIHQYFLGNLYDWAGKFRTVEISKNNTLFAASRFIPDLLKDFDRQFQKKNLSAKDSKTEIAEKLAFAHSELNAIHPFREGNGRTLRLFLDLLAGSVGYQPIIYPKSNKTYFDACGAGMKGDNKPMERVIMKGLMKK